MFRRGEKLTLLHKVFFSPYPPPRVGDGGYQDRPAQNSKKPACFPTGIGKILERLAGGGPGIVLAAFFNGLIPFNIIKRELGQRFCDLKMTKTQWIGRVP